MVIYWKYYSKYVDGAQPPYFLLKIPRVDVKIGGGRPGKTKYFSHINIFRTNIHMYETKHSLIQYCLSPFQ